MGHSIKVKDIRLDTKKLMGESQEIGKAYLLRLDPDRLLAPVYEGVEKEPVKPSYEGWEGREIKGHSVGHYLSAVATMYAATNDQDMKERMDYVVDQIAYLQREDGYVGGVPSRIFDKAFTGAFEVEHFSLNSYWVPWYSIHKLYAGLIDAYILGGNQKALDVVLRLAEWTYEGSKHMTDEAFQRMLISEHGGMNEVMAELYAITQNEHYLHLAKRFTHEMIIEPLAHEQDDLQGKHANTQIPKVIGAAKLYEVTGDTYYQDAVHFFFNTVATDRSFVIGGNSNSEHFGPTNSELLAKDTAETCNTYNMMKLAEYLFKWTKESKYMDYYERALYNHILASQDPDTGAKTYFVSTYPGHFKVYGTDTQSFWCCTGSGMENPGRYTREIYFREDDDLYINLFIASTLKIEDKGVVLVQDTSFPESQKVTLYFKEAREEKLTLKIRVPYWVDGEVVVKVGTHIYTSKEQGYLSIEGNWKQGDKLELTLPMGLHEYVAKDDAHKIAIMYGPLVLAGALGKENFPETDIVADHISLMNHPAIKVPTLVTEEQNIRHWVRHKEGLTFEIPSIGRPGNKSIDLKPFYALHHERYSIYWTKLNEDQYKAQLNVDKTREEVLNQCTIDTVRPGNQQSEIEHNFKGNNAYMGYLAEIDRSWREANGADGFISYKLEVKKGVKNVLNVSYYGLDEPLFRSFIIEANDVLIADEKLEATGKCEVVDKVYAIPEAIVENAEMNSKGKFEIEVRFKNKEFYTLVGKLLEIRTLINQE